MQKISTKSCFVFYYNILYTMYNNIFILILWRTKFAIIEGQILELSTKS